MNRNTKNIVTAFDFDGVIWDSVDECFHVGYTVFRTMEGEIPLDAESLRRQFRNGRYLAKDGEDFYILLHLLQKNPQIDFSVIDFQVFESLRLELAQPAKQFTGPFYAERKRLQETDFDFWLSLQTPFPEVLQQLPGIRDAFGDLVICSTKDTASIHKLLGYYNQTYPVYGREISIHKPDQMERVTKNYSIPFENILFIDDLMENLLAVKTTGALSLMATWGYNNPREYEKAAENHIPLLQKENLLGQLKKASIS